MTDRADCIVIGAGMAGLAAARALRASGLDVTVLEAADTVGGLARSVVVAGEPIEPYYHHVFPQDRETLAALDEVGMADQLEWRHASMGILHRGRVYPFDSPLDLLRFPAMSLPSRIRFGAATASQVLRRDTARMDSVAVAVDASRWFGRSGYEAIWRPMLEAKFGPHAPDVAMAWLVARIRQRAGARRSTGDRLGYLRGGIGALAAALARRAASEGVESQALGADPGAPARGRRVGRHHGDAGRRGDGGGADGRRLRERARARPARRPAGGVP